jgi:hypothetical protein
MMSIVYRQIVMNKNQLTLAFLLLSLIFISCGDDTTPTRKTTYRPLRIEEVAYKRELIYNQEGQITKVVSESQMPDNEKISTVQEFNYSVENKIATLLIDNERLFQYTYEEGRIVKTEETVKGIPSYRYIFTYRTDGMIKEMHTYKYEGSGAKLMGKINYAFDPDGNISSVKEFSFQDPGYSLEMIYEYDRYDNFTSADSHFDFHTLNTGLQLHKNNPGRMVSKNKNGVAFSIEDYVYDYNVNGYPVKRESTITLLHIGSTGSYITHYFFEKI